MEPLYFIFNNGRIEIQGFSDDVRAITLTPIEGKWLADLSLHREDLQFSARCLDEINLHPTNQFVQQALWRCAVVHFVKCFGDGARRFLQPAQILKGQPNIAVWAFGYMKALRHKHIIHDDNTLSQSISGAILNAPSAQHKIAKVFAMPMHADTLMDENYSNLKLLCELALGWVEAEFDCEADRITVELEKLSHDELNSRVEPSYQVPQVDEIDVSRKPPRSGTTGATP